MVQIKSNIKAINTITGELFEGEFINYLRGLEYLLLFNHSNSRLADVYCIQNKDILVEVNI